MTDDLARFAALPCDEQRAEIRARMALIERRIAELRALLSDRLATTPIPCEVAGPEFEERG